MKSGRGEVFLGVVGMADCGAQALVELGDVQENLLRVDGGNRSQRHRVFAGILDIDHQFRPAVGRHLADGPKGLARLGCKHLKSFLDRYLGHAGLHIFGTVLSPR